MLAAGEIKAGRFRIIRLLGEGAMKRVYLAVDQHLSDRPCALAEIPEHITRDTQREMATAAFEREAQMLASLEHPSIPRIYDFFTEGSIHYLVMEYVEGKTLETVLAEQQRLPWLEAAKLGIQILNTLAYLHARKPPVLYRDLKPSNVMVGPDQRVRMVDFGIARHFNPAMTATMVGTQGYAPPEQYKGRNEPRSDLYSFGALMHHAVTGRDPALEPPFSFPPVWDFTKGCHKEFAEFIDTCLAYNPTRRPISAVEARAHLEAIICEQASGPVSGNEAANAATVVLGEDGSAIKYQRRTSSRSELCTKCGHENLASARFCNSCGASIYSASSTIKVVAGLIVSLLVFVVAYSVIVRKTVEPLTESHPTFASAHKATPKPRAGGSAPIPGPIDMKRLYELVGYLYNLDPALLEAIADAGSNGNPNAVSKRGAEGLMQLMPATARKYDVDNPFDPVDSVLGAARYLDHLRTKVTLKPPHQDEIDLPAMIAAYYAGPRTVEKYKGIPPDPATQEYVRKVLWFYLLRKPPAATSTAKSSSIFQQLEAIKRKREKEAEDR